MILTVGDVMADVLLLPELVEEEQTSGMVIRGGGSAANSAAWIADLGDDVCFVGCVGDDALGAMLVAELRQAGVRTAIRAVPGMDTGCVAVEITSTGERLMRSSRGANQCLVPSQVTGTFDGEPAAIHLTGYSLLGPHGPELFATAASLAESVGAVLSFDPSSVGVITRLGRDRMLALLTDHGVNIFLPNLREAASLTDARDATEAADILGKRVPTVVVKDGARGAAIGHLGETGYVPTTPLSPIDTTGAGDAFNAGILTGLLRSDDIEQACRSAHAVAARAIFQYGGRPVRRVQDAAR